MKNNKKINKYKYKYKNKIDIILIVICLIFLIFLTYNVSKTIYKYNTNNGRYILYLKQEIIDEDYISSKVIYGGEVIANEDILLYKDILIKNKNTYQEILYNFNIKDVLTDFDNYDYLLVIPELSDCSGSIDDIVDIKYINNKVYLNILYRGSCGVCATNYYIYFIPIKKDYIRKISTVYYDYIKTNNGEYTCDDLLIN